MTTQNYRSRDLHASDLDAALKIIDDDNQPKLRSLMERLRTQRLPAPFFRSVINGLLLHAVELISPECLAYLAEEFGDIHYSKPDNPNTTLALAIHSREPHIRARMFKSLMSLATDDALDESAPQWSAALKTSLFVGDVQIIQELASFIGARRFSEWLPLVRSGTADAWFLAARNGNPEMIPILMAVPEMSARFDEATLLEGHMLADLAESYGHARFAQDVLSIASAKREQHTIGDACCSSELAARGFSPNRRM